MPPLSVARRATVLPTSTTRWGATPKITWSADEKDLRDARRLRADFGKLSHFMSSVETISRISIISLDSFPDKLSDSLQAPDESICARSARSRRQAAKTVANETSLGNPEIRAHAPIEFDSASAGASRPQRSINCTERKRVECENILRNSPPMRSRLTPLKSRAASQIACSVAESIVISKRAAKRAARRVRRRSSRNRAEGSPIARRIRFAKSF